MEQVRESKRFFAARLMKYFLLALFLSFLGWAFEVVLAVNYTGEWINPGAMRLPLCPIYGVALLGMYRIAGTPDSKRGLLKKQEGRLGTALYFIMAFVLPTLAELIVAACFDLFYGIRLWDYSHLPFNFHGYISLIVSFSWAVLIFFFMKYLFEPIKKRIWQIPYEWSMALSLLFAVLLVADLLLR